MKALLAVVKRWYLRRFRGIVNPPAHAKGQGTTWQQHPGKLDLSGKWAEPFACQCGENLAFCKNDLKILSQEHNEGCEGVFDSTTSAPAQRSTRALDLVPCNCPILEARYVKICPSCRIGHWKQAK